MRCPIETHGNAELLLDYSTRKLNPELTAVLEAHMDICPACREFRDGQRAMWNALDQWEAASVSPDFDRRLYRRIEDDTREGFWSRLFAPLQPVLSRPAVPMAATACVFLVAGFIVQTPGWHPAPADDGAKVREVEQVEQVERTLEDLEMLRQFNLAAPDAGTSVRM
ncbi:MAG: hypothetical protein ABIZ80_04560 [Bryobacteraceae bacterium]